MPMIDGTPFFDGCPCDEHVAMDRSAGGWGDRPGGGGEDDDACGRERSGVIATLVAGLDQRLDLRGASGNPPMRANLSGAWPPVDMPARGHGDGDYPHQTHEPGVSPFAWPDPDRIPAVMFDDFDHHGMRGGPDD